jgi:hypothetical protein
MPHHPNVEMPNCEMGKQARDPSFMIQWCRLFGNMIEGPPFLFSVNRSMAIQLLMQFLEVHSVTARND